MADPEPGFGDPGSVEKLAAAARQSVSDLDRLIELVNRDVRATVPDQWGGDAANAFQRYMFRVLSALSTYRSRLGTYVRALDEAAEIMRRARQQLEAVRQFARSNELEIQRNVVVVAINPNQPGVRDLVAAAQQRLDEARETALEALQRIRSANQELDERTVDELSAIPLPGRAGGRRPRLVPPRDARRDRTAYWRRHDELRLRERERAWLEAENRRHPGYRQQVQQVNGSPPADGSTYVAHHNFPVAESGWLRGGGRNIDPENPMWGSWVRARDHEQFTPQHLSRWREFIANNPNATRDETFAFARRLATDYGHPFGW
jgi:uncharacterized protein YukE